MVIPLTRKNCFLRISTPRIGTFHEEWAMRAIGALRVTDLSSVTNQAHMQRIDPLGRGNAGKDIVSLVRANVGGN